MKWRYKIMLEWVGPQRGVPRIIQKEQQVIDHADDVGHARYLVAEYKLIYGSNWRVRYEKDV